MKQFSYAMTLITMFSTILVNAPMQPVSAADSLTKSRQSVDNLGHATVDGQRYPYEQLLLLSQNQKSESTLHNSNKFGSEAFIHGIECHNNLSKCSNNHSQPPTLLSPHQVIQKAVSELPILLKKAGAILLEGVNPMLAIATVYVFWKALSSSSGGRK